MRCFVLLSVFLLFSGVFCDSKSSSDIDDSDERGKDNGCWYIIDENAFDLSSAKGRVLSYTQPTSDGKNITWNWSLCGPMNGTVCDPSSAMCVVDENGKVINYGNASTVQTVTGDDDALTLKFTDGDECAPGQRREAVVYLLCSKKKKVEFVVKDVQQTDCSASLTIASRWGCAVDFDEDDDDESLAPLLISIFGSVFCLVVCASVILCCARRRWMKKRAFQRLQEEMQTTQVPAPVHFAPQPMFHPQPLQQPIRLVVPVQQGQQMYYPMYPPVQMPTAPVPTQPAVAREAQVQSDEQMAQQLQAQFNKEAQ
jgi:hypothetical protein